ncbi:MAG TPA: methionine biosynthesis protein MetW, partial [Polyangiaceae bacterium]|nr:methionine biosynthesis protein MetW [Polyangiaceae bacterium]
MPDKESEPGRSHYRRYEECGVVYGDGSPERRRPEVELFLSWIPEGARVVDLACGSGTIATRIARERNATVSGVEIDPRGVEEAKRRGISAVVGDLDEGIPFEKDAFDVAVINVSLHMVYRPRFLLEEALRVARQVIVTFPNFGYWLYRVELSVFGKFPKHSLYGYSWYDTRHIHLFSLADLRALCRELGVGITAERFTGLKNRRESKIARLAPNLFGR